ncbi:MAG: sigma-54-dependent Fis family transcriptional regulator [Rubrivivax sp.]|nr:sigma-54-dependent Fis family transcriptional regulator [Rubrivivax sp.]
MNPSHERQLGHAQALRARGSALPPDGMPPPVILDSWVRCMAAGLDVALLPVTPVVEAADLARRRDHAEVVRRLARAELETLSRQISGSNFLLAFADREGVILDLYADNRFSMSGSDAGIVVGSCWREEVCGTNGMGTALATGQSVSVSGLEHYLFRLGGIACTATPIRDAGGETVGVLDASSYLASRQRHTQALMQMAATHIENGLLTHQMRGRLVLAIHPRAEYLATLSAGLLAFDDGGRLQAANARAHGLLAGLGAVPGVAFEQLFGEGFEQVLARLHVGGEARLHDALGSALVVRVVSRPASRRGQALQALRMAPPRAPIAVDGMAPDFVAADPAVAEACRLVRAAVRIKAPILIHGETGTGKELLARHAHRCSERRGEFVAVNCGAIPDELFEAELFGHVGGAFTGARRDGSAGLIASADGGTLLLDELSELPAPSQAALLRFLDEQAVRPVGGTQMRRVDVQLLAASNADLLAQVTARRFRADLLYRLNTVQVALPPLRLRQDFSAAVHAVLAAIDPAAAISAAAVERLALHGWPGNFRELRSLLTRALLQHGDGCIERADVEPMLPAAEPARGSQLQLAAGERVRSEFERCGRSVSRTARSLGISRTTVYRHLRGAGPAKV